MQRAVATTYDSRSSLSSDFEAVEKRVANTNIEEKQKECE